LKAPSNVFPALKGEKNKKGVSHVFVGSGKKTLH